MRESLRFSATLRQPKSVSKAEKFHYVEEVIDMLNMREFADAIVGVPGQGLNVEQRKLLTIGVELAAKPKLLLFLDEPTSGLDSQSSWAICSFLRKLADAGQAILCVYSSACNSVKLTIGNRHYSSTICYTFPRIRSSVVPGQRWENGLLWSNWR